MRERDIENELIRRVKAKGGEVRKVKWIGRKNAPDRLVGIPMREIPPWEGEIGPMKICNSEPIFIVAQNFWVELKRPGEKVTAAQAREHERMRAWGMEVYVCSTFEELDTLPL